MNKGFTSSRYIVRQVIKWVVLALAALLCYFVMTSGSTVKPLLLIPLAMCVSVYVSEIPAAAVGVVGGLLTDIACGKLLGYNAVWLVVCCVTVSLLHSYYLREKFLNILGLTAVCTVVQGYLDFMFYYAIWGHENVTLVYTHVMLPSGIMTLLCTIPIWLLVRKLFRICGNTRSFQLEKTIVSNG